MIEIDRSVYQDALTEITDGLGDKNYAALFKVSLPDDLNTASVLEICNVISAPTFENKIRLLRICIAGKKVEVTCPDGSKDAFIMSEVDDSLDAIPLFQREPIALIALTDSVYGYLLKKYVRLSKRGEEAATTQKGSAHQGL